MSTTPAIPFLVSLVVPAAVLTLLIGLAFINDAPAVPPAASPTVPPTVAPTVAQRAFPSAQGWGTETPGGRGGQVCQVTNLDDSGPGSFRDCVTRTGPRIVVFRVSGTITTLTRIDIKSPNLTVLGQTAPGGGITLRGAAALRKDILRVQANDVVIRYLRFRHGTPTETSESADNLLVGKSSGPVRRVVIDHSSFSWAVDGNLETYYEAREITFSWNLITEPLGNSKHPDGEHAKNMHLSGDGAGRFTIHHNLLANGNDRNPQPTGLDDYDMRNNVIYNWGKKATYVSSSKGTPTGNIVGNYWKRGPNTTWDYEVAHYDGDTCTDCHRTFVQGNIGPNRPTTDLAEANIVRPEDRAELVTTPFTVPQVTTTSAAQAYIDVLAKAGASFPFRDPVDERAVTQTLNNTGAFIDNESQVGGYPTLPAGTPPVDTDGDGMPDSFESAHGTDPAVADATGDRDGDGYSNIEDWANSLVGEDTAEPSVTPVPA
ncbi:MAG: hypothetical protein AB7Q42_03760 [Acidimicrobiia bacterium]